MSEVFAKTAFAWLVVLSMIPILLLTKNAAFRMTFLTILYPVFMTFISKTGLLNTVDPVIIMAAGSVSFLLSWFITRLSKKARVGISDPTDHTKDAIGIYSGIIGIFAVMLFAISSMFSQSVGVGAGH